MRSRMAASPAPRAWGPGENARVELNKLLATPRKGDAKREAQATDAWLSRSLNGAIRQMGAKPSPALKELQDAERDSVLRFGPENPRAALEASTSAERRAETGGRGRWWRVVLFIVRALRHLRASLRGVIVVLRRHRRLFDLAIDEVRVVESRGAVVRRAVRSPVE